jgi:hypothetical protein
MDWNAAGLVDAKVDRTFWKSLAETIGGADRREGASAPVDESGLSGSTGSRKVAARTPRPVSAQWEIIQGLFLGKLFEPSALTSVPVDFFDPPEQHPHPGPWLESFFGLSADRAFTSWALIALRSEAPTRGGVSSTRGLSLPQSGHAQGDANSAIGRSASNGP